MIITSMKSENPLIILYAQKSQTLYSKSGKRHFQTPCSKISGNIWRHKQTFMDDYVYKWLKKKKKLTHAHYWFKGQGTEVETTSDAETDTESSMETH